LLLRVGPRGAFFFGCNIKKIDIHMIGTSTQAAVQAFVRQQNIKLLERVLRAEADPDDRRILRRLLREQERSLAAET